MTDRLTSTSKFLAYVLRHRPGAVGITLDPGGWIEVDVLLAALARHRRPVGPELLAQLVTGTDRQRFELHEGRIRAAQGHSIRVDLQLQPATPPPLLYHGTVARFLVGIGVDGLLPRGRTHVHLSSDRRTAATVGARRGEPVILTVDAAGMHRDGFTFYRAVNGVWLTDRVPPTYLATPT
ncbi:putative RNA 2'-phosphotransferase [Micromonospora phaseoli]|uniref:Probable RNA 2'-phosphotransferase n=1 Tax=Micromonospora phaseoli TaxID=1144548 RepID=A0A1H7DPH6_9ACTN|nr:RNA 2'-phosphotransferase [Micromonospora phaseoli]PZV89499.1 putative RNA 2'-phosphotransferase [Micromonospora phaseoli]GIJ80587.1 putative RNA 2'-phosphotransferase [Micromonospora phaseoli]SEK03294.1 putative RNA 2'-phosphotransferase [Micromonospora phaseoli]